MANDSRGRLRVDFVTGVTPDKWARTWAARRPEDPLELTPIGDDEAEGRLRAGEASLSLLRLPVDRSGLHVIPLYEEAPVVVVAKDHAASAFDDLDIADLADEVLLQPADSLPAWRDTASAGALQRAASMPPMTVVDAIAVASTGAGFVVVPLSVARAHHRKDVVHRPVRGVAGWRIGLAWRVDDDDPRIEEFVGVVRGRTERSSRGRAEQAPPADRGAAEPPAADKSAAEPARRHTHSAHSSKGQRSGGRTMPQRGAAPRRGRGRKAR